MVRCGPCNMHEQGGISGDAYSNLLTIDCGAGMMAYSGRVLGSKLLDGAPAGNHGHLTAVLGVVLGHCRVGVFE